MDGFGVTIFHEEQETSLWQVGGFPVTTVTGSRYNGI